MKSGEIKINIHRLIVRYGDSLPDKKTIAEIINHVQEKDMSEGLPKKVNHYNVAIEEIFEILYEIFPNPYCV